MLTEKQYNLLMFINKVNRETGKCPSFDEMKDAIGLKSKSGIHALITSLEERNFIRRLPHKARAMEVVRLPRFKPQAIIDEEKNVIENRETQTAIKQGEIKNEKHSRDDHYGDTFITNDPTKNYGCHSMYFFFHIVECR